MARSPQMHGESRMAYAMRTARTREEMIEPTARLALDLEKRLVKLERLRNHIAGLLAASTAAVVIALAIRGLAA